MTKEELYNNPNWLYVLATAYLNNKEPLELRDEGQLESIQTHNISCFFLALQAKVSALWAHYTPSLNTNNYRKKQRFGQAQDYLTKVEDQEDLTSQSPPTPEDIRLIEQAKAMVERSWLQDSIHIFFKLVALCYAFGCGITIAGGMISLLGASTAIISMAIFFGCVGFWINWRNSQNRIPELIAELFFQPTSSDAKWYQKIIPGLHFYHQTTSQQSEENQHQSQSFNTKQVLGNYAGLICSLGVGLSIGAITWEYSSTLALAVGLSHASWILPVVVGLISFTLVCELCLQLRSFIDIFQSNKMLKRFSRTTETISRTESQTKKVLIYAVGLIVFAICTAGLIALTHAAFGSLLWVSLNHLGASPSVWLTAGCWAVASLHFIGTLPYNFEMVMNCMILSISGTSKHQSLLDTAKAIPQTLWHYACQHKTSMALGWVSGFCGYTLLASLPVASSTALAMTLLCLTGAAVGLATGLLLSLLQERLIPRMINATGNGIVSQKDGLWGILSACIMSFISSYADVSEAEFIKLTEPKLSTIKTSSGTPTGTASGGEPSLSPGVV